MVLAALWGVSAGIVFLFEPWRNQTVVSCLGLVALCLSFPLGWLGFSFPTAHGEGGVGIRYFLLLIPNFFLLGYSMAGLWRRLRRREPTPASVSAVELKQMVEEHRRQHE
jgi:hypothetical protein